MNIDEKILNGLEWRSIESTPDVYSSGSKGCS